MVTTLGIHIGHHTSCAVVRNGELVAAVQLERISRRKHHVTTRLTNELPIEPVLAAAGTSIKEVDLIVSSFAAAAPAGVGLGHPLVADDFSLFDPTDQRHRCISHHLAHARCAFESSGLNAAAVLVCDYAGSTTTDGADYDLPFSRFLHKLTTHPGPIEPKTEWLSIYRAVTGGPFELAERRFCIAHPTQSVFVHHVAGLYENVSQYVIGSEQAHGQLMALAASGVVHRNSGIDPGKLYSLDADGEPVLRNDWQARLPDRPGNDVKAVLAYRCQEATEAILTRYAHRARLLSRQADICLSGGTFLNILANTAIWRTAPNGGVFVPSAPHDAGIAAGCAYHGWRQLKPDAKPTRISSDALGPASSRVQLDAAVERYDHVVDVEKCTTEQVAGLLSQGRIVARMSGRSEFGPRALGRRSLLADPRNHSVKDKLNDIKGRQPWRPVAPIITLDQVHRYFEGPPESPWMNMSYTVRAEVRELLPALAHPDHSTRPQTVDHEQDRELYALLNAFEQISGLPILVNTSLNRRGEPIVETAEQALELFLSKVAIDFLVIDDHLITRKAIVEPHNMRYRLSTDAILTRSHSGQGELLCLIQGDRIWNLEAATFETLERAGKGTITIMPDVETNDCKSERRLILTELIERGVLLPT